MDLSQEKVTLAIVPFEGADTMEINMVGLAQAEARLEEMASVTSHTSSELLSFYNKTWLRINDNVTQLTHHKHRAQTALDDAFEDALLGCTDEALEAKGHKKSSADLRKAMANRDPEVKAARDRFERISVMRDFLAGKAKAFERAFRVVQQRQYDGQLPSKPLRGGNVPTPMAAPSSLGRPSTAAKVAQDDPFEAFGPTRW